MPRKVDRSKTDRAKRTPATFTNERARAVTLRCGHGVDAAPIVSNPEKWWCDECRTMERRKSL